MSTWTIIFYSVIGSLVGIGMLVLISRLRKYSASVTQSLFMYAKLAKSCKSDQLALVFQEIAEFESMAIMTHFQRVKLHSIYSYLEGRMDQANIKDVVIVDTK